MRPGRTQDRTLAVLHDLLGTPDVGKNAIARISNQSHQSNESLRMPTTPQSRALRPYDLNLDRVPVPPRRNTVGTYQGALDIAMSDPRPDDKLGGIPSSQRAIMKLNRAANATEYKHSHALDEVRRRHQRLLTQSPLLQPRPPIDSDCRTTCFAEASAHIFAGERPQNRALASQVLGLIAPANLPKAIPKRDQNRRHTSHHKTTARGRTSGLE